MTVADANLASRSEKVTAVVQAAVAKGLLPGRKEVGPVCPCTLATPALNPLPPPSPQNCDLYDMDALDARLVELRTAFPEKFFEHAIAVKANPTTGLMQRVVANGVGLECASLGEVSHSVKCGASHIIFDSPCKTKADLHHALVELKQVYVNLDNESEMEDIEELIKEHPDVDLSGRVGLRINPVTGEGGIGMVSTAGRGSKFGLPLVPESKEALLALYKKYTWLQGVHIHVGSQGCPLTMLKDGAATILQFVKELEAQGTVIKVIDIGGGMPTSYLENDEAHRFSDYRKMLDEAVPDLFTGKYRVMTEFGRCVMTKPGITLSRIAAVKGAPWHPERPIAIAHVGSNQFLREAYVPDMWRKRFTALSPSGGIHAGADKLRSFDICGPLCFQGDYLVKNHALPEAVAADDVLCIHDTGGYCLALWSHYNSRQCHAVYGYRRNKESGEFEFCQLKVRETMEETGNFWGPLNPASV